MRFNFKDPPEADRHSTYEGETLDEANEELRRLRCWLYALTEQLEYVIGREANTESGKK